MQLLTHYTVQYYRGDTAKYYANLQYEKKKRELPPIIIITPPPSPLAASASRYSTTPNSMKMKLDDFLWFAVQNNCNQPMRKLNSRGRKRTIYATSNSAAERSSAPNFPLALSLLVLPFGKCRRLYIRLPAISNLCRCAVCVLSATRLFLNAPFRWN